MIPTCYMSVQQRSKDVYSSFRKRGVFKSLHFRGKKEGKKSRLKQSNNVIIIDSFAERLSSLVIESHCIISIQIV